MSPMTTLSAACATTGPNKLSSAAETVANLFENVIPVSSSQRSAVICALTAYEERRRRLSQPPLYHAFRRSGQIGRSHASLFADRGGCSSAIRDAPYRPMQASASRLSSALRSALSVASLSASPERSIASATQWQPVAQSGAARPSAMQALWHDERKPLMSTFDASGPQAVSAVRSPIRIG